MTLRWRCGTFSCFFHHTRSPRAWRTSALCECISGDGYFELLVGGITAVIVPTPDIFSLNLPLHAPFNFNFRSDCNEAVELAGYRIACETVAPFSWPVAGSKIVWMLLTVPFWAVVIMRLEGGGLCRRNAAQHHQPDYANLSQSSSPDSRAMVGGNTELQVEFGSTARIKDHLQLESRIEDDDVRAERRRIDALQLGTSAELQHHTASAHHGAGMALRDQHNGIVLRGLRKVFPDKRRGGVPIVAVADLSLQCKPGDILGILGHNGAHEFLSVLAVLLFF